MDNDECNAVDEDDYYVLKTALWTALALGFIFLLGIAVAVVKLIGWAL